MSLSSLREKMNTSKMLVFLFLVGLLSLTFLVFKTSKVFAATTAPIAPTSTSNITAQAVRYNWTAPGGESAEYWVLASSTNISIGAFTLAQIVTSSPTSTVDFTFNGLATNTRYIFGVAGGDFTGATSSFVTSSAVYTLATTPGTPTVTSTANQTMKIIVNTSTNPVATTYVVKDTGSATTYYLQDDHTWGTATATFDYLQLGDINGTTTIGLATNTLHTISVAAINGDSSATTSYSATASVYTTADTPGVPILSATTTQGFDLKINSSTNPAATTYIIRDTASSTRTLYLQDNHTWDVTTATFTYTQLGPVSGTTTISLATNTLHRISVAAVNGDGATSSYGTAATDIYTLAATPAAPTVTSTANQTLKVVINVGSNSTTATTTFVVKDTGSATTYYLQNDHTWGTATATFNYDQLGGSAGTTTIGLATSSPHFISVAAVNGDSSATTTYSSVAVISTIPNTPTTTLSVAALTTFTVTINSSTNPTSTVYIIRDTGGSAVKYLQTDHTWGTTTATLSFSFVAGLVSTSTTGLTANTPHVISVAAVSGDSTATSSYGATASLYTLANVPSSVVLTAAANGFTLAWSGDSNEEFWADDLTNGTTLTWATGTSFSVGGINCGTTHTFAVAGRNGDSVVTASSSALSATTNACGGTGSIGGGGIGASVTPAIPAVPGVSPAVPASVTLPSTASPVAVFVHTLRVGSKGAEVKQLQQTLRELGFFKHPTNTGLFGAVTKAAVVAFQKAQGFKTAPGIVGVATRAALNSESAVSAGESAAPAPVSQPVVGEFVSKLGMGSRGAEVRMLQAKLRELGFFNHPTDTGLFGAVTRAAVAAFQKDQGLSSVGFVGPGTRAALNSL